MSEQDLLSASFDPIAYVSDLLADADSSSVESGALAAAESSSARVRAALAAVDASLRGLLLADDGAQLGALLRGGAGEDDD